MNARKLSCQSGALHSVRVGAAACGLFLSGCWVTERYIATPAQRVQAAQLSTVYAETTALPVHRYKKTPGHEVGKAVYLRADALTKAQEEPALPLPSGTAVGGAGPGGAPVVIRSRRYSPVVTAGATLTGVGSIISVVGTIIYFTSTGDNNLAGGIVALSAEPMMLAGTLMWIFGILRPPQEVAAGRAEVRYLEAAPALPTPPLSSAVPAASPSPLPPAPAPALSLRF